MMGFGWLAVVVFWALLAVAAVWLLRETRTDGVAPEGSDRDRALNLVRERYARGEIDRDTFTEVRRTLGG